MNIKLLVIFYFILANLFAQSEISYDKVLNEIRNSSNFLCTNLLLPNDKYNVGIFTKEWEVEDLTMEQCGDIKTDSLRNSKILRILESENLLEKLYIQMDKNNYSSLNTNDEFEWNKMKMVIDLSSSQKWDGLYQVYIPIKDKKQAKELVKSISKIFDSDYCFKKLKRKI